MLRIIRFLFFDLSLLLVVLLCIICNDLVIYGLAQGQGQVSIVMNARPVEEFLKDPALPDSLRRKLILIGEIKRFAYDSLGLKPSDNYSTVYNQHDKPVLWTITASEPFRMKAVEWFFPFLGTVSYKGFFNYEKGKKQAEELESKGFDVDYGGVSGWSTLGWFKDPILSNMLKRNEGQIADLIIHELTHGTLYVKNNVDFNENLASFIGDKGAERFLTYRYGRQSPAFEEYMHSKTDRKIYNAYVLYSASRLDSLYRTFRDTDPVFVKEMKKMELIYKILEGVQHLSLFHKASYLSFSRDAVQEKNAFFMSFRRYDSEYDLFEKEFTELYGSDIKKYIYALSERMGDHPKN